MGTGASSDAHETDGQIMTQDEPLVDPEGVGGGIVDYGATTTVSNERDLLLPDNLAADRAQASEGPLPVPLKSMFLAETLGTFLLVQLGTAANAVNLFLIYSSDLANPEAATTSSMRGKNSRRSTRSETNDLSLSQSATEAYLAASHEEPSTSIMMTLASLPIETALMWGSALAVAMLTSAALSGGHVNPAVSLSFALVRPAEFRLQSKLAAYWMAQVLGAALAAMVTLFLFHDAIGSMEQVMGIERGLDEKGVLSASVFNDYYQLHSTRLITNNIHAGFIEAFGTGVLCFTLFVLTHRKIPISGTIVPVLMGLVYAMLVYTLGPLTGGAFNPAREIGPRLVTWLVGGWGWHVSYQAVWPYIIGPLFGGPIGAFLADRFLLMIM